MNEPALPPRAPHGSPPASERSTTSIIELALEVRESPSEVLRRLQNSTIPSDHPSAEDATGRFEVTALDGTPIEIRTDAVSLVRSE